MFLVDLYRYSSIQGALSLSYPFSFFFSLGKHTLGTEGGGSHLQIGWQIAEALLY